MATESLLRDFAIIMATGAAALVIFRWLKQPPVLGYLIAGALVGPYMFTGFTVSNVESVRRIADLGLLVILFTVGVELGWQRIRRVGASVIIIAVIEVSAMLYLGMKTGIALGWTQTEALFLGAALSMTSSAVLVKYLRDTGQLHSTHGQIIIGIAVIEDLLAVILLSLLSGVAITGGGVGGAGAVQLGGLAMKLGIFAIAVLVLGTMFVPRLLRFLGKFDSPETLLLVSLGLCFGLGLTANELGISATAGAFLIGTVVGDTEFSEKIGRIAAPVRDVFAALFFVSIGMLVNFDGFGRIVVPTLVVAGLFIGGKIAINAAAALLTGHDGRTSAKVGAGMPLLGEFSLAMVKTGSDHGAVGAALYPVVAITSVITSFLYPFGMRLAEPVSDVVTRRTPAFARQCGGLLTRWFAPLHRTAGLQSEDAQRVRRSSRLVAVNLVIIATLLAVGAVALHYAADLAAALGWGEGLIGMIIGAAVITLCVPSGLVAWSTVSDLTERLTARLLAGRFGLARHAWRMAAVRVTGQSLLAALIVLVVIWALPVVVQLLAIGSLASPAPIVALAITVLITARLAVKVQEAVEAAFRRTILGE